MNKKIGLVLEGGGFRGIYSAGILDFFLENKIEFPYVIGVSMGACNGANYISKQIGRNLKVPYTYINDKRYISYTRLIKHGELFGMDFIFNEVPNKLIPFDFDTFYKSRQRFVVVTTDCNTGKPHYYNDFKKNNILEVLKASTSLPFAAPMVLIQNRELLDGGISDSIPIHKAFEDGCEKLVVILTRHRGYRKSKSKSKVISKLLYRKYPALQKAILERDEVYNKTLNEIEKLEKENKIYVIRPPHKLSIGRIEKNREKLKEAFDVGYNQCKNLVDDLINFAVLS
jgi:predicted patatin/cPLA2 family phospholipase